MKRFLFFTVIILYNLVCFSQDFEIPFEEDGWVYIQVSVNDSNEKLSFVFDTGASSSVIDKGTAQKLGIKSNHKQTVTGASGNETYNIALKQKLNFGKFTLKNLPLVIVDLKHLKERSGRPIDGIVGYDMISKFITQLDFNSQRLKLYSSIKSVPQLETYSKLKIRSIRPIPKVSLGFTLKNGIALKGDFLFDSGANSTLILTSPFVNKHNLRQEVGDTYYKKSSGLTSTVSEDLIGNLKSVVFNNSMFTDVPITLSNSKNGVLSRKNIAGILGAEIINRFQIVLDYDNNTMYLKPNKSIDRPFKYNYSGFTYIKKDNRFIVEDVIENSPVAKLGIVKGDELLSINDYDGKDMRIVKDMFQLKGETLALKVKKENGTVKDYKLKLERILK